MIKPENVKPLPNSFAELKEKYEQQIDKLLYEGSGYLLLSYLDDRPHRLSLSKLIESGKVWEILKKEYENNGWFIEQTDVVLKIYPAINIK